jgi:AGZA family xanthine/uracil permease-like MFS transporter
VITYTLIKAVTGKGREVHPLLYGVAILFVIYFLRGPLETLIS